MSDEKEHPPAGPPNGDEITRSLPPARNPRGPGQAETSGQEHPKFIGPYTILRVLGEGGMGTVYLAEQIAPVRRQVALKIVKLGMDSRQTLARFDAEREALAMMNHSGVAKVFDAGVSEQGRPYFVMEYVQGVPITAYCDQHRLSFKDRLQLFVQVCQAIQHAHQKGIIHRDIKPSNVLVAEEDGAAVPKVIDFGIAKATQQRLTEQTLFTEQGQFIGTPGYMSPEQAGLTGLDIDTRTDVYSLGVLLYELLVGARPFDDATLRRAGMAEIHRIIQEVEPPKPSTRLSGLGPDSTQIALNRRTELRTLNRILRGDLDWVVMKCLEKDRNRRYDTANALAMEIRRFLQSEPVLAGPPSAAYRLRKLARKHRVALGTIVAVVSALTIGLTAALFGMTEAQRQRAAAERSRQVAEAARIAEAQRAKELEQVSKFQEEQLAGIDVPLMGIRMRDGLLEKAQAAANQSGDEFDDAHIAMVKSLMGRADFTGLALEVLDKNIFERAVRAIDRQFESQPLVRAQLLQALGHTARRLGLYERAQSPQEAALDIRRRMLGSDHPLTLRSINDMGLLLEARGNLDEAESYYREGLETRRPTLGKDHPDTLTSMHNLAVLMQAQGKFEEAEPVLQEAVDGHRRVLGNEHPDTLNTLNSMGFLLAAEGKLSEAESYYREALAGRRRALGNEHADTITSLRNYAGLLADKGEFAKAEPLAREVLAYQRKALGNEHPSTLGSVNNLGYILLSQGKLEEAEPYLYEALENKRRALGDKHPSTLTSINNLATLLARQEKYGEAEKLLREALKASRSAFGQGHPLTLGTVHNFAFFLNQQKKYAESLELLRGSEAAARAGWEDGHPKRLGGFLLKLGEAQVGLGDFPAAEKTLLEAYDLICEGFGSRHDVAAKCAHQLIRLYDSWDEVEADAGHDESAAIWRRKAEAITTP